MMVAVGGYEFVATQTSEILDLELGRWVRGPSLPSTHGCTHATIGKIEADMFVPRPFE